MRTRTAKTDGGLPQQIGGEVIVYVVKNNRIVDVQGSGPQVETLRH